MRPAWFARPRGAALAGACALTVLALAPAAAGAQTRFDASAGIVHRRLVEWNEDGGRFVTESGELLRLQAAARHDYASGGAVQAQASIAAGRLDYDGHAGSAPLASHTGHRDLGLQLAWRPLAAAPWGEAWLTLDALQQRRQIAGTPQAHGLQETSTLWMPGVRWAHAFEAAGWRWQPGVDLRVSARHRLEVDFGGIFDTADLTGGRRRELALSVAAAPLGSRWSFGLEWSHARQSASPQQVLLRGGAPVGTVRQPRITIDDVSLRATRSF